MNLSVIICTYNPHAGRLARTLEGLAAQTLPYSQWECILVDNASSPALTTPDVPLVNIRCIRELRPGLNSARRCGLRAATGELCVFVDDDNVLAPDYLENAIRLTEANPKVGAYGGRSIPEFETPPAEWTREFFDLLALRDLGAHSIIASSSHQLDSYPPCAPIGAGMVLRHEAAQAWLNAPDHGLTDRRGNELTSGGDNDIVLTLFTCGWEIGYFPELALTHLIPPNRLTRSYLGRLNRGIQKSWVQVLLRYNLCPWSPIAAWTVLPRKTKAWFTQRAWSGDAAQIRWQGACGHFEGLATRANWINKPHLQ